MSGKANIIYSDEIIIILINNTSTYIWYYWIIITVETVYNDTPVVMTNRVYNDLGLKVPEKILYRMY